MLIKVNNSRVIYVNQLIKLFFFFIKNMNGKRYIRHGIFCDIKALIRSYLMYFLPFSLPLFSDGEDL